MSNFPHKSGDTSRPILQRVYARETAINESDLIFDISEPMLEKMIDYFGVGYPLPKLDQIALPGLNNTILVAGDFETFSQKRFQIWCNGKLGCNYLPVSMRS